MTAHTPKQYNSAMIILHWVMALAFFAMLGSGITMEYITLEQSFKFQLYQWHKSLGVLLLLAIFLRIFIKILSKAPPLPQKFSKIEKTAAHAGHYALYLAMLTMVFSGWAMVSSSVYGLPTIVFGWFEWPHIPNIQADESINSLAKTIHFYGFITFGILILGHISAVVAHYKKEKVNLLWRMWWGKKTALTLALLFISTPALALEIDTNKSTLTFEGEHAGNAFTGTFKNWQGDIDLDAQSLTATFDLTSAHTGNAMYDGTLPSADWFDSANHPKATFKSTAFKKVDANTYNVTGDLTLKGATHPVSFNLNLTENSAEKVAGEAMFTLNRLLYNIGKKSDPKAEWVSKDIGVTVQFTAP